METLAAIIHEQGAEFKLEPIELSQPGVGEVLVKLVATGLCHTDLAVRDQYYPVPLPAVLGHEGAGHVQAIGPGVIGLEQGDPVVLSYNYCGPCRHCLAGRPLHCDLLLQVNFGGCRMDGSSPISQNGKQVSGYFFGQSTFSTHAVVSARSVVKVERDLPLELLGPLGCAVQTGVGSIINVINPEFGSKLAIFGIGAVGMSAVMGAALTGSSQIIAVDVLKSRLDTALKLGATHVVDASACNPVEAIQEITQGGADYCLEAAGQAAVLRQAVDALRLPGTCVTVGVTPFGTEVSLDVNAILTGKTVRGAVEGNAVPQVFIPLLIEFFRQGRLPFDKMIEFYELADINKAVKESETDGRVIKPVLRMPS